MVETNPLSLCLWLLDNQISLVEKEHKRFTEHRKNKHYNYIIIALRERWWERDATSIEGNSLSISYCTLEDYPRSYHYMMLMFHIIFPRYLLSETVEMHCWLYMLQLFFILTDFISQIWIFAFTIITSLLKPHLPQYDPQDAIPRNSSKEAYFLPVRPIPSYQRSTVTWLQFQHILSLIPDMSPSQSEPLSGHSATLFFHDSTS